MLLLRLSCRVDVYDHEKKQSVRQLQCAVQPVVVEWISDTAAWRFGLHMEELENEKVKRQSLNESTTNLEKDPMNVEYVRGWLHECQSICVRSLSLSPSTDSTA